ncbi:hypothetical protein JL720_11865 [Aureococcus anophagefferens]|nr:hypothetical protein JL720_11865 [Aureococcus anophagefferens]
MEAAPEVGLTCCDSVDAAKALALPWPDLYYSPAWGAVELAAGASAWELALWRRRDDASDGAGPAFVAYAYAKRPVLQRGRRVGWDLRSPYGYSGPWSSPARRRATGPRSARPSWPWRASAAVPSSCASRRSSRARDGLRAAAAAPRRRVATIAADLRDGADGYWRRAAKQHRNKRAVGDVVLDWTLGTSVLDPGAFDALMAIRAGAVHTDVVDLAARAGAFFPAYRAGLDGDDRAVEIYAFLVARWYRATQNSAFP